MDARLDLAARLAEDGYAGPVPVFTEDECRALLLALESPFNPHPKVWGKGRAAVARAWWEIASDPRILDLVRPALGPDIILWGASLVEKRPGDVHPWHTDIESAAPEGGFVSVWVGLEKTSTETGLSFISGSHLAGRPIQQALIESGRKGDIDDLLALAREHVPAAQLVHPPVTNGEAFLFDGRTWHGSRHEGRARRIALLLQYARADRKVRFPVNHQDWPFVYVETTRPPCVVVAGSAPSGINNLVPPPVNMLDHQIHEFSVPLHMPGARAASKPFFRGPTPPVAEMECHASILMPGESPHPPHRHAEEELLVVIEGQASLILPDGPEATAKDHVPLGPGEFSYYPANRWHTLTNPGTTPLTYLVMKWVGPTARKGNILGTKIVSFKEVLAAPPAVDKVKEPLMNEPTLWLDNLHSHFAVRTPGFGYDAHADDHDVAIMLLEGNVTTLGRTVKAPAMIFHPAGTLHGLVNTGDIPARYLVFEFHRAPPGIAGRLMRLKYSLPARAARKAYRLARGAVRRARRLVRGK